MAFDAHKNLSYGRIVAAPSPALSGTSLTVDAGQAATFPAVPFNVTVWPSGAQALVTNAEILRVTAIVGDVFTVVRAQEGSTARSIIIGDQIAGTITAKVITDIEAMATSALTSVGLATDAPWLTVSGSPITSAGTLTFNRTSGLAANRVLATPDGAAGVVGLRALVSDDIPVLAESKITGLVADLAAKQPLDATLTALAAYSTNGLLTQTAADTFVGRSIVGTAGQINVANGSGVAGNPTLNLIDTAVVPAVYGSATEVGQFTADQQGRITLAASVAIALNASQITAGTLPIARGGTNSAVALSNNRILVSAAGALVEAGALTNGQLLIGSTGAAPVGASISGTANQVIVTAGAGSIALSGPQDLAAASSPTFGGLTLTGTGIGVTPTLDSHLATKGYVDAVATGLDVKKSVRLATTANITLSGEQAIDGVTTSASRVLVKNQSTASENGLYVSAAGAWARSTDADTNAEVTSGMFTFVEEGTVNENSGWVLTTDDPITLGTTGLAFSQFSGAGQVVAGAGLTKTGNTLDVIGTADRISVAADSVDIASTYVGQASITTLGTVVTGAWNASVIPAIYGGTGLASYAVGDLLFAGTTTSLSKLAGVAPGNALISGGVSTAPAWGKIELTTHVSGILPVANGGSGTSTAFTTGSVLFAGASGVYAQDNANLFWDDTNNRLGIGVAVPLARLHVVSPAADAIVQIVKGFAAQTANLTEWQNSSAAALVSIGASGNITVPELSTSNLGAIGTSIRFANSALDFLDGPAGTPILRVIGNGDYLRMGRDVLLSWSSNINPAAAVADTFLSRAAAHALATPGSIQLNPYGVDAGNTSDIRFLELAANGTNYTGFKAADAMAASEIYVLPDAAPAANRFLRSGAVAAGLSTLSWAQVSLTADVTGILPVANGGSGTTTAFTAGSVIFAGAAGVYAQDNANLFWDDTNNRLGIGTSAPGTILHLAGANPVLKLQDSVGGSPAVSTLRLAYDLIPGDYGELTYNHNTAQFYLDNYWPGMATAGNIIFRRNIGTGGSPILTETMTLNGLGNIGIGETVPGAKLQVNTVAAATIGVIVKGAAAQSANLTEWQSSAGAVMACVDEVGNVGIGTASPGVSVDVIGSIRSRGGTDGSLLLDGSAGGAITFLRSGGSKWAIGTDVGFATDDVNFYNYGFPGVALSVAFATNNVGIGVTGPTAVLHLKAGTTTASTAPLKFNTGTSLTTAEAGAMEFTTDDLFFTITTGAARKRILFADATAGLTSGKIPVATTNGRLADLTASAAYTPTNVTPDRTFDADSTILDEIADVLGTLVADLQTKGILG